MNSSKYKTRVKISNKPAVMFGDDEDYDIIEYFDDYESAVAYYESIKLSVYKIEMYEYKEQTEQYKAVMGSNEWRLKHVHCIAAMGNGAAISGKLADIIGKLADM